MPQIELTKVAPGMVLAADVIGSGNKILVTAGSVLSLRHIKLLKTRAVTKVEIHEIAPPTGDKAPQEHAETKPELLAIMTQRFRENDDHPFVNELKKIWLSQVSK